MSSYVLPLSDFPQLPQVDIQAERRAAHWEAALKRIAPADLEHELRDLLLWERDPETSPFAPLIREILVNPPEEPLGSRYYSFHVSPAILRDAGRRLQDFVQVAFDRVLTRELTRLDVN